MYGRLYCLQPQRGQEQAVLDALFRWEQEILPSLASFVAGYIFQPVAAPEIVGIFIFATQADYARIREHPEHMQWQLDLLPIIAVAPQYSEGSFTEFMKELRGL